MTIKNKKGYFLSADALIALIIIISVVIFIKPTPSEIPSEINIQQDLLTVLSTIKIGEINNSYAKQLITEGKITHLNQSVLEQIGEFYANSDPKAETLAESVLNDFDIDKNLGLYFNDVTIATIGNTNISDAEKLRTARQIISGIQAGDSVTGYSSRAFLSSENPVEYIYFGGYIGDGNISTKIEGEIKSLEIEAAFSGDFEIYINGIYADSYSPQPNTPYQIDLSNHLDKFSEDENILEFRAEEKLYISGGYIKITHNETTPQDQKKNFPGIKGFINLYDSFFVLGNLTSMDVSLHFNSTYDIFLTIGNKTIFEGNTSGADTTTTISNSEIQSILDYSSLNKKTIPYRLGIKNVSDIINFTIDADIITVNDLSGSMAPDCSGSGFFCCLFSGDFCGSENTCNNCGGTWEDKISAAREANKAFVNIVLNFTGNQVGLVGYRSNVNEADNYPLTNDSSALNSKIDEWTAQGSTCICCGINTAVNKMLAQSRAETFKSLIVMSDGEANIQCPEQSTGNAKQDAINAACDAYNNYGIKVYSVGFGEDADEGTLQDISSCGHGNYYYGDISELVELYEQIAEDILRATYVEQTVVGTGTEMVLHPDSFISLNYTKEIPYGLVIPSETDQFGNNISEGTFIVPNDTEPFNVNVISYSGSKWTDKIEIYNNSASKWEKIFDLSDYGTKYTDLGDPYAINIPTNKISFGENKIKVTTAANSTSSSGGSPHNKIIYSLLKEISSYSPIVSSAEGCSWTIEFEDESNLTLNTPKDYNGTKECLYTSGNIFYNNNDAIDYAIHGLLASIDLDSDGRIEIKFNENDLTIDSTEVSGIPFTWETEVQARIWR